MRPELKRIHSPDIADLESFRPKEAENFGFLLQAMFGPDNGDGEEAFDLIVCTPKWFEQKVSRSAVISGRHHSFVKEYSIERVRAFLIRYGRTCEAENWHEVARKLSRIAKWEFEDYVPHAQL
ncbi:MAG TPA: immunity 8 family protein [Reyranella sp.]|nr:immunity 8 family protein [Reyranella sp.]